jgi:tetratricopeptide (TPR) repeat protein
MMKYRVLLTLALMFATGGVLAQPGPGQGGQQRRTQGPVLIKDFEEPGENGEKVYPHDPKEARRNVEVGEYYFKRNNYDAAVKRFSEAIEYDTAWAESYKKLIKALDEQKEYASAVDVCRKFAENNPDSGELDYFMKAAVKYEEMDKKQEAENPDPEQ